MERINKVLRLSAVTMATLVIGGCSSAPQNQPKENVLGVTKTKTHQTPKSAQTYKVDRDMTVHTSDAIYHSTRKQFVIELPGE